MPLYPIITPVDEVWIGAYGADKGACAAQGSVESVTLKPSNTANYATAAKYRGAKTAGYATAPVVTVEVVGDNYTLANMAMALGAAVSGTDLIIGASMFGAMGEKVIYVDGVFAGGVKKTLKINKAVLPVDAELKLMAGEQNKYTLSFEALYDDTAAAGAEYAGTSDLATDTTPPTFVSSDPAAAATGVAKAAGGTFDVVFSEAMNTGDFNAANVVMFKQSDGAPVTLTSIGAQDAAGTTLRLVYPLLSGTTVYTVIVSDVRDLAGNKLAAAKIISFTTGS